MLDLAGCALWNTILGTSHIKKEFFFFLNCKSSRFTRQLESRPELVSPPALHPRSPPSRPLPPPGAGLAGAAPSRAPTWFLPAAVWMGRPPDSAEGAVGRGRARAPAAAAPAPAPRRPTPGSASLGRAWAGARAANVARAESPNVTARGGWRRRRRAGEGEDTARAGRRREGRKREDAAGEVPLPPPARLSPEEPPPPPTRPSGAPSGLAGRKKRRVRAGGGARRARPPPSLPPSMGAGASRPPQPPEEGELGAVTSELGLSRPRGRACQDRCSRWPSTYLLAVRQVRDALALVRPRANLGRQKRRAARALGGRRPGERAPRGRHRKERAASGSCGRFPE